MKAPTLLFLLVVSVVVQTFAQGTADPLMVTLPNGKVLHFQTAEQKAKYEAALQQRQPATSAVITPAPTTRPLPPSALDVPRQPTAPSGSSLGNAGSLGTRATICGKVVRHLPEGLVVDCAVFDWERREIPGAPRSARVSPPLAQKLILLVNHPDEAKLPNGSTIGNVIGREDGLYDKKMGAEVMDTYKRYQYVTGR